MNVLLRISSGAFSLLFGLCAAVNAIHVAQAAEVAQVVLESESGSAQSNVPVTFGHVFRTGDVPAGMTLQAALDDGTPLPTQADHKATHGDGSLRHAVVTVKVPSMAAAESKVVTLSTTSSPASGSSPTISEALAAGVDAVVALDVGGQIYSASAADMLRNQTVKQWLSGPLVSEWIVGGPLKTASGSPHSHLAAYFHVRYYATGRARIDVVIENGWTFVSNPNSYTYDATITVPGVGVAYSKNGITHYSHARWHSVVWWNGESKVYAHLDTEYLQSTKAVPNYKDVTPSEAKLDSMTSSVGPMEHGDLRDVWSPGGAHAQLAPLPEWTALYLVSGDKRAYDSMIANSDALGAYSLHYRDGSTGLMPTIDDYPAISITIGNLLPPENGDSPFIEDRAHQPSTSYVPYLVTGDYFHLEELQYMANYNLIFPTEAKRNGSAGEFLRDHDYETRGWAWGLRAVGEAGYATPDGHALKGYFTQKVNNNLSYIRSTWSANTSYEGYPLGIIPSSGSGGPWGRFSYWQQAFFAWSVGHLSELGYNAGDVRDWKSIWTDGIMGPDFCYQVASVNRESVEDPNNPGQPVRTFAELWAIHPSQQACETQGLANWMSANLGSYTYSVGEMAYSHLYDSYHSNFQPALAIAVDAGIASTDDWTKFVTRVSPNHPDYRDNPQWAIEPRSQATAAGKPVVSLSATPNPVTAGGSVQLSWAVFNADSCSAEDGWSGARALTGSETVGPIDSDTDFSLNCTGTGGATRRTLTVTLESSGGSGGGSGGGGSGSSGTNTANGYVWDELEVGKSVYVDRNYTYSQVPGTYVGMRYLQTKNDDKFEAGDGFLVFYLGAPATVFVAYDNRLNSLPGWLSSWTDTGDDVVTTDTTLRLYRKSYSAGEVSLGGNENGQSMYTVLTTAALSEISDAPTNTGGGSGTTGGSPVSGGTSTGSAGSGSGALDPLLLVIFLIGAARRLRARRHDFAAC